MVTDPGTTEGAHGLRPLGTPRPVEVRVDRLGGPAAILRRGRSVTVAQVRQVWRVAEAWWRDESLARTYVEVVAEDGTVVTLFHDDREPPADGWYEQRY